MNVKKLGFRKIIVLLVLLTAIPLTVYIARQQQEIRQRASETAINFYGRSVNVLKVFGQRDFTQTSPGKITGNTVYHSSGVVVDKSSSPNKVYVFDTGNNRILGFNGLGTCSQNNTQSCTVDSDCGSGNTCAINDAKPADIVLGQQDMESGACNRDNNLGIEISPSADSLCLIGYPSFVNNTAEYWMRANFDVDPQGNLYIPDTWNNRILKYNQPFSADKTNGKGDAVADFVWGQETFTENKVNGVSFSQIWNSHPPPSARTLRLVPSDVDAGSARGVSIDTAGNVWVADSYNNRVLRFPPNSKEADLVIGQPNFTTSNPSCDGLSLNSLCVPQLARVHPTTGELYVLEERPTQFRARILVFTPPFRNGMIATKVIVPVQNGPVEGWDVGDSYFFQSTGFVFNPYKQGEYAQGEIWVNEHSAFRTVLLDNNGNIIKVIGERDANHRGGQGAYTRIPGCGSIYQGSRLWWPGGSIGFDSQNNMYLADERFHRITRYAMPYTLRAAPAGSGTCLPEPNGGVLQNGPNTQSNDRFGQSTGLAVYQNQLIYQDNGGKLKVWNDYLAKQNGASPDFVLTGLSSDNWISAAIDGNNRLWIANEHRKIRIYNLPLQPNTQPVANLAPLYWQDTNEEIAYDLDGMAYDPVGNAMYVVDLPRHRIFRIKNYSETSHLVVDMVLGQRDKTTTRCNFDQNMTWMADGEPTADSLCRPSYIRFDNNGNLFVVENVYECHGNNRITVFMQNDLASTTTLFPRVSARKVFGPPNLTTRGATHPTQCYAVVDKPGSPMTIAFNSKGQMVVSNDGYYGNKLERPKRQLWFYSTPLEKQTPDSAIELPMGTPGDMAFDNQDNLIVQDHTWNRMWVINLDADPVWLTNPAALSVQPPPIPLGKPTVSERAGCVNNVHPLTVSWTGSRGTFSWDPTIQFYVDLLDPASSAQNRWHTKGVSAHSTDTLGNWVLKINNQEQDSPAGLTLVPGTQYRFRVYNGRETSPMSDPFTATACGLPTNTPTPIPPTITPTVPTNTPVPTATPTPANTPTPTTRIYAEDVDRNGCVGIADFNAWSHRYRTGEAVLNTLPDIDGNNAVNLLDYNIWFRAMRTESIPKCN